MTCDQEGLEIPDDCIPEGNQTVCELHAGPDLLGRYRYTLYWNTDFIPRAEWKKQPSHIRAHTFCATPAERQYKEWRVVDRRQKGGIGT